MKSLDKSTWQNIFKAFSFSNTALNKFITPLTSKGFEKVNQIVDFNYSEDDSTLYYLIKKTIQTSVQLSEQCAIIPMKLIGIATEESQKLLEKKLKEEFSLDVNSWMFSSENMETIEKISALISGTAKEIGDLGVLKITRFIIAYSILQRLTRTNDPELIFGKDFESLKSSRIKKEANEPPKNPEESQKRLELLFQDIKYHLTYAISCYGDLMNYVYSGKDLSQIVRIQDYDKEFMKFSGVDEKDFLYSNWSSKPYHPSYCVVLDRNRHFLNLCFRGSFNWADVVTDLDFNYLNFSIMEDEDTSERFLTINYMMLDTNENKLEKSRTKSLEEIYGKDYEYRKNQRELYSGFAHAGMFFAAIELFKNLGPKVNSILESLDSQKYSLRLTGHSLGGGITTLLTLFFLIHPPKAFSNFNIREKVRSFTFGAPPILSAEFQPIFKGVLVNLINHYDFVTRLSYGTMKDLIDVIKLFEEIEQKEDAGAINRLFKFDFKKKPELLTEDERIERKKYLDLYRILKIEVMNSQKLYHLGDSFVVEEVEDDKEGEKEYVVKGIADKEYFNDIIFSKKMLKFHMPHIYLDIFDGKSKVKFV